MSTGLALGVILFVLGAIFTWVIQVKIPGIDQYLLGYILMGAGVLSAIIGIILGVTRGRSKTVSQTTLDNGQTATTQTKSNVSEL